MPAQSRLLPIEGYSGYDLVPFRSEYHPDTIRYILENSLLTMGLRDCHLHCASQSDNLYALDFQLATGLWFTLKNISRTIHLAANPLLDPFNDLLGTVDPELLARIGMPFPAVLSIEKYTQNLLIIMSNRAAWLKRPKTQLEVDDAPKAVAGPGEIVIKNVFVAINPVDWKVQAYGPPSHHYPSILGQDIAGEVVEVGRPLFGS